MYSALAMPVFVAAPDDQLAPVVGLVAVVTTYPAVDWIPENDTAPMKQPPPAVPDAMIAEVFARPPAICSDQTSNRSPPFVARPSRVDAVPPIVTPVTPVPGELEKYEIKTMTRVADAAAAVVVSVWLVAV
jgi:hypothetical protein